MIDMTSKVKLVYRLMNELKTVGYVVENNNNAKVRLSIGDVTNLASKGLVENADVKRLNNGRLVLYGTDMNISELPAVDVRTNEPIKIRKVDILDSEIAGLTMKMAGGLTEVGKLEESGSSGSIIEIVKKRVEVNIYLNNKEDELYSTSFVGSSIRASSKHELTMLICCLGTNSILKVNYKEQNNSGNITNISRVDFLKVIVASMFKAYKERDIVHKIELRDSYNKLAEYKFMIR